MQYVVDSEIVDFVWTALNEPTRSPNIFWTQRIFKQIFNKEWAFNSDIEDLVGCMDARLSSYQFDVIKFANSVGIRFESVCYKPNAKANSVTDFNAIRVEDAVLLLIILERIGFQTDATDLVNSLLPAIHSKKKKLLSEAELEIFWFSKTRHKHAGISLMVEADQGEYQIVGKTKTNNNYLIELKADETGKHKGLEITAPKYRKSNNPVRTTCPECGTQWYKGDTNSSYMHRREHKIIMTYLNPQPSMLFLEERATNNDPELVTFTSAEWKHKEMYARAKAFKREFSYDFIQWQSPKGSSDLNVNGFLLTNEQGTIIGACSFRKRTQDDKPKLWALQWIWICPKERRKGHLAIRWKMFRERFGHFIVEPPVSDAMKTFLEKNGDSSLLHYPASEQG